jgi:copper chaperone CopZ
LLVVAHGAIDNAKDRTMEPTQLTIFGMTCGHCETAVRNALEAVDGVTLVTVDRQGGSAVVTGSAPIALLIEAVDDAGFDAAAQ